jgi:hypothetical protein
MRSVLVRPVEFVAVRLAPTTELAGLAELARLDDHDARVQAVARIARAIREEDDERARVAALRRRARPVALPRRGIG